MKIVIKSLIGKNALTMTKGNILYNLLLKELGKENNNDPIIINFDGVMVSSQFFNASISYLLKDYTISQIQKKIKVEGLTDFSKSILNVSFSNAVKFYNR